MDTISREPPEPLLCGFCNLPGAVPERRAVPTSSFSRAETDELMQEARARVKAKAAGAVSSSPGKAQIDKVLMAKKVGAGVEFKVVDRMETYDKDGTPGLVSSTGACGSVDDLMKEIMAEMDIIKRVINHDEQTEMSDIRKVVESDDRVGLIYDDEGDDLIGALTVVVKAAMDSGACASVLNPDDLPAGVAPSGNPTGAVFHGANNSPIRRFGSAVTRMKNKSMDVGCRWQVAEVSRPLNAVSEVCGPMGPVGLQDVLFNNNTCYVVPPGVVAKIMEHIQAVAEYPREGNLYLAEIELSSFARQGPAQ